MKTRRRLVASLGSAFTLVVVICAWIAFAPPQLGGQTSYVIISGNSMEPGMHRGDLAVIRQASRYQVGEVVTYRHPQIGPVIHRIVAEDGAAFVFQGDHNTFIDPYHPTQQELIGALWFHVPAVGTWLARFHSPVYAAGLLFVPFIGLGGGSVVVQNRRSRRQHRPSAQPAVQVAPGRSAMQPLLKNWQDTLSVLAAIGLGFAALAWVGFHRPLHHDVPANAAYTQAGEFHYSAASSDGRVYDAGAATSGEPVYRRLSDEVNVGFDYKFSSEAPASVSGTYQLVAELSDQNGWRRTLELTPVTSFQGVSFSASGVLSLSGAQEMIDVLETQTGVKNERYTVTFDPRVRVTGKVGGIGLDQAFAATLPMQLDAIQLRMSPVSADSKDPLSPSQDGTVKTLRSVPNSVRLLAIDVNVGAARALGLLGVGAIVVALGSLLIAAEQFRKPSGSDSERLAARYGGSLVSVTGHVPASRTKMVDVASVEDLGRMAERFGSVILQEARPGYHCYFVQDGDITYRYQALGKAGDEAKAERGAA
jgi:signal peptidase I